MLARDTLADLQKASAGVVETTGRILRVTADNGLTQTQINTILATGVAEGTPVATTRALRDELIRVNNGNIVPITDRNGNVIHFDAEHYASMVVRTKTREAVVVGRLERFQELDIDLVAIIGRLSNNFCTAFLGQVYSISGKHSKYPALESLPGGGPPFHPFCSKGVRPFIEGLSTERQRDMAEPSSAVNKLVGKSPAEAQRLFKDLQLRAEVNGRVGAKAATESDKPASTAKAQTPKRLAKRSDDPVTVRAAVSAPAGEPIPQPPVPRSPVSEKTAALQAKAEKARAARLEAQARYEAGQADLAAARRELAMLENAATAAQIASIKRRIAALEANIKAYERAVRAAERRE